MIAACLADFFNLGLWPAGREVMYPDIRDGLEELVAAALEAAPTASEIGFRLYGGWQGEVPDTRVTLRDLTASVIRRVPMTNGRVRLRFTLAEAPVWDPALRLLRTVRSMRYTHVAAEVEPAQGCHHLSSADCPLGAFTGWASGSCPEAECEVRLSDVASGYRQKMVDTLMTADAMSMAREEMTDIVLIASDDDDLLPALLALKEDNIEVIHMTRSGGAHSYYRGILERDGVGIHEW